MHFLRCMGSKFCVKFQRAPLKFHTKFWTHTPQNMNFTVFYFCVWVTISLNCDVISLSETGPRYPVMESSLCNSSGDRAAVRWDEIYLSDLQISCTDLIWRLDTRIEVPAMAARVTRFIERIITENSDLFGVSRQSVSLYHMMTSSNGNIFRHSPVTGEFPAQRPVTRSFDVFLDLRLNKRLSKQSWGW